MKKNILQSIKILVLGLILGLCVTYVLIVILGGPPTGNIAGNVLFGKYARPEQKLKGEGGKEDFNDFNDFADFSEFDSFKDFADFN